MWFSLFFLDFEYRMLSVKISINFPSFLGTFCLCSWIIITKVKCWWQYIETVAAYPLFLLPLMLGKLLGQCGHQPAEMLTLFNQLQSPIPYFYYPWCWGSFWSNAATNRLKCWHSLTNYTLYLVWTQVGIALSSFPGETIKKCRNRIRSHCISQSVNQKITYERRTNFEKER